MQTDEEVIFEKYETILETTIRQNVFTKDELQFMLICIYKHVDQSKNINPNIVKRISRTIDKLKWCVQYPGITFEPGVN